MVLDLWDQDRDTLDPAENDKTTFEDDSCVKSSSHFEQANEFFAYLKILLDQADILEGEQHNEFEEDKTLKKLIGLIDPYQEQPFLLDPHLENMVKPIMEKLQAYIKNLNFQRVILNKAKLDIHAINSKGSKNSLETNIDGSFQVSKMMKRLFRLLYYIMKIRGFKTIVKFFTHEVSDLEPTFYFLVSISPEDYDAWEMRYVLLIWLSFISMIPFDLKTVDSHAGTEADVDRKIPLVDQMIDLSKLYLNATGKERDGAAVLLSRLLTRRDIASTYLADYVEWATHVAQQNKNIFTVIGILESLCAIFKLGQRTTLLPIVETASPCLSLFHSNSSMANNSLIRKLLVKLAQRLGLCFLKPKIASWRYQRGNRSLKENLARPPSTSKSIDLSNVNQTIDDSGLGAELQQDEVPEQIEDIIEILLKGLRDKDTIVRWSAAKGIGRLGNRLPQELADDVLGSLLELFSENSFVRADGIVDMSAVSDHTWHGTCLAVAELARRGLLLPKRLDEVIPWITKALKFDLKRATHSIGSHVRDAACYVCWSFARAYAPEVLAPHVKELANNLVVVSVFDREVNVRRASSAAFQENVGRQGIFPHGIDIITTADYFTVGNRTNAFLQISVEIARFPEYRKHLIDHLSTISISNWDKHLRELCAQTLHNLTKLDVDYMINTVLPRLIAQTKSKDLQTINGALMAIGEVCLACSEYHEGDLKWHEKNKELIQNITNIIGSLSPNIFTDFGSELSCQATAHYVACLARSKWPVTDQILAGWKNIVHDLLGRKDEYGQKIAVRAVEALHILDALILASTIQETKTWNDAETRRNAIISLTNIPKTLGSSFKKIFNIGWFRKIMEAFFIGLEDYSTESRGDVGSWVREVSMLGLATFVPFFVSLDEQETTPGERWWDPKLTNRVFASLLKQSVERIDRIRDCAGKVIIDLLYYKKKSVSPDSFEAEKKIKDEENWLLDVSGRDLLQEVLPRDEEIHWITPSELYPRMIRLLSLPEYRLELLSGLIIAAGGMTETLVRYSSSTLIEYADGLSPFTPTSPSFGKITLLEFVTSLFQIFRLYERNDRVMLPLLEVTDLLFEAGILQKVAATSIDADSSNADDRVFSFQELFDRTRKECQKSRDIRKISACIRIFCGFVSLGSPYRNKALFQLLGYLVHPYPKIRRFTAEQLYMTLIAESVDDEIENFDEMGNHSEAMQVSEAATNLKMQVEDILTNTNWDEPISNLRLIRDQLYPLLGVPPPVVKGPSATA
ncbi:hypothetical protein G9A89_009454 [Geosiphon pyriformis]|nr:hypothetical protein G9A89_009454 [Geosiphon pyriformis]